MLLDVAIFSAFYGIALGGHWLVGRVVHIEQSAGKKHTIIATALGFLMNHPPLHHALHEFCAHIVVYSGLVIPQH